jgi:hypothetical protein
VSGLCHGILRLRSDDNGAAGGIMTHGGLTTFPDAGHIMAFGIRLWFALRDRRLASIDIHDPGRLFRRINLYEFSVDGAATLCGAISWRTNSLLIVLGRQGYRCRSPRTRSVCFRNCHMRPEAIRQRRPIAQYSQFALDTR